MAEVYIYVAEQEKQQFKHKDKKGSFFNRTRNEEVWQQDGSYNVHFFSSKDVSDEKVFGYAEFFPCINVNTAKVQIKYDFVKETKFVRLNSNLDNK